MLRVQAESREEAIALLAAASRGHRVFVPLGWESPTYEGTVVLHRPPLEPAAKALETSGRLREKALPLGALARQSLLGFRRKLAVAPKLHTPAWDAGVGGDREALARLADRPYKGLEAELEKWCSTPDPPVRRSDGL